MADSYMGDTHIGRKFKRLDSRKSHSWWWDSHISPKNSKWLTDNLDDMDQSIKRMLKLIEEDADSFAKKAEMYYQKRPVLISHVEEFYRMYRSLAERYDHVTGELRKNFPSDLQSQGSGISDLGSEPSSTLPSPDQRLGRRKSGPRAAGFEFFLGSGGSTSDTYQKEGDESSSSTDSEPESDDSSVNNYSCGGDQGLNRKMIELEIELREAKEKLRMKEDKANGSFREPTDENFYARMAGYEEELRVSNEKLRISEVQIMRLKSELQKSKSSEFTNGLQAEFVSNEPGGGICRQEHSVPFAGNQESELEDQCSGLEADPDIKVVELMKELKITKETLEDSQKEVFNLKLQLENNRLPEKICHLQDELDLARKDTATWRAKFNAEKREVSKLQERISRLKSSLSDRDHESRELKLAVSDAEQKIFPEKAQVKAEISKLVEERARLMEQLREWEHQARLLEDEIRKVKGEKVDLEEKLNSEIEQLKTTIVDREECIEGLKNSLDRLKYETDQLQAEVTTVKEDLTTKNKQMAGMGEHMQQLQRERVELVSDIEQTHKLVDELRLGEKELKEEIEKQRVLIMEGAEEKREAIRQLCFSIEHYRSGYHRLREVFVGHKRVPVLAS